MNHAYVELLCHDYNSKLNYYCNLIRNLMIVEKYDNLDVNNLYKIKKELKLIGCRKNRKHLNKLIKDIIKQKKKI